MGLRVSLRPVGATSRRPGGEERGQSWDALVRLAAEARLDALGAAQVRPHLVPGRCVFAGSCQQIMLFRDGQRYSLGWKCKEMSPEENSAIWGEMKRLVKNTQYNTISLYVNIYCNKKQACKVKS